MDGEQSCRHQQQKASVELQRADWLRVWERRTSVPPSMPQQLMEQRLCAKPLPDIWGCNRDKNGKRPCPSRVALRVRETDNRQAD